MLLLGASNVTLHNLLVAILLNGVAVKQLAKWAMVPVEFQML